MSVRLRVGTIFAGDYRIVRVLGQGGMGAVYVALQLSTEKERALKVIQPFLADVEDLRSRFVQEARIGARIDSDHVVEVIGAGIDEATQLPWLAMELLRGEELAQFAKRRGALTAEEALRVFEQLCHALAAAHRAGIVHRDLKPANVFLAASRRSDVAFTVKVLDFGIAKILSDVGTEATAAVGTPLWMAPEQAQRGKAVGPPTDVWAMGLIAFRLLTGGLYWQSPRDPNASPMMLLNELLLEPLANASERAAALGLVLPPPGFDAWFHRCVARDPAARYPNAGAALESLRAVLAPAEVEPTLLATVPALPATVHSVERSAPSSHGPPKVVLLAIAAAAVAAASFGAYRLLVTDASDEVEASVLSTSAPPPVASGPSDKARALCASLCATRPALAESARTAKHVSLAATDTRGRAVAFSAWNDKVTVVSLVTPSSQPAQHQVVSFGKLARLGRSDVELVLVVVVEDPAEDVSALLGAEPPPDGAHVVIDTDGRVAASFGTERYPETFIIDAEGRVRARYDGVVDLVAERMLATVDGLAQGADCPASIVTGPEPSRTVAIEDPDGNGECKNLYNPIFGARIIVVGHDGVARSDGEADAGARRTRDAAKDRAEEALEKLAAGAVFADVAAEYSDDPRAKSKGGDLGLMRRDEISPEFWSFVEPLKVGATSAVLDTAIGYMIVQRTD